MAKKPDFMFNCEIVEEDGYFSAKCLNAPIFTEGPSMEAVLARLQEAITLYVEAEYPAEKREISFKESLKGKFVLAGRVAV